MKWKLKINGREVKWQLSDVVAVVPPPYFPCSYPELEKRNGKYSGEKYSNREQLDRKIFERAGWRFIETKVLRSRKNGTRPPDKKDIRQVFTNERGDVLIETDVATIQLNAAAITKEYTAKKILAEDGLTIIQQLKFAPNLYVVRLPYGRSLPETINALQAKTDRYVFAEPSMLERISGRQDPNDPLIRSQWQHKSDIGLQSIDAWRIAKGTGVRIAIIDNGMEIYHDDLRAGIVGGGYFQPGPGTATATFVRFQPGMTYFPDSGHGTACMGMAGARQNNRSGGSGIAPEAELLAVACALDQIGSQLTLAQAIDYAVNPQHVDPTTLTRGADVISCSLDTAHDVHRVLEDAINSAATGRNGLGVPVFWAVNNVNQQLSDDRLCSLANVIAVGRSADNGKVYRGARGPKLEFLAPGLSVLGPSMWNDNKQWSGTSFATPLAAGVAALVLQRHPTWTSAQVLQRLRDTCVMPQHPPSEDDRYGHGRINAFNAVFEP